MNKNIWMLQILCKTSFGRKNPIVEFKKTRIDSLNTQITFIKLVSLITTKLKQRLLLVFFENEGADPCLTIPKKQLNRIYRESHLKLKAELNLTGQQTCDGGGYRRQRGNWVERVYWKSFSCPNR